jgi:hypothetical protein
LASKNNKRALKVIRNLRSSQNRQAEQIDMLCHDMVSAHREFSTKLETLKCVVSYYERLLRCTDLETLLKAAVKGVRQVVRQADAAVFLLSESGFELHQADSGSVDSVEKQQFCHWFTRELVSTISQMNRVCSLDQLLRMGIQGPPAIIKTISLAAIPLGRLGHGTGFILVYRPADLPLQAQDLSHLAAISIGLRDAIEGFQTAKADSSDNPLHV